MATAIDSLHSLIERARIRETLERYFRSIDRSDHEGIRNCFTKDVVAQYGGRPAMQGVDALMASLDERYFRLLRQGGLKAATHFMGSLYLDRLDLESARSETYALAFLVRSDKDNHDTVVTRSLRYLDELRLEDGQWRISKRVHTLDWSTESAATFAVGSAHRLH